MELPWDLFSEYPTVWKGRGPSALWSRQQFNLQQKGGESVTKKCTRCNGTGRCEHCRGSGKAYYQGFGQPHEDKPCSWCHGTGVCQWCHGKGER
jgi:hypothetical protein